MLGDYRYYFLLWLGNLCVGEFECMFWRGEFGEGIWSGWFGSGCLEFKLVGGFCIGDLYWFVFVFIYECGFDVVVLDCVVLWVIVCMCFCWGLNFSMLSNIECSSVFMYYE